MSLRSLLSVVAVLLLFSCKKDKNEAAADEAFVGTWRAAVQLKNDNVWLEVRENAPATKDAHVYTFHSDHTCQYTIVNGYVQGGGGVYPIIDRWFPVGTTPVTTPKPDIKLTVDTVGGFWEYRSASNQLIIKDSSNTVIKGTFDIDVFYGNRIYTKQTTLTLPVITPGVPANNIIARLVYTRQ
ncbi:hypothetical protein [Chitinophaga nivalis]|uniref:Lipocalin-like domain-containing protein n=1 Tax=Chitinophaga nivalis TaxID=2991709 RepID=A0ABT3IM41_9BACT|nr:hypothetical protein [Chitinophaga nivalis]MCW3465337.1 hypothetical protein [Chitinophaga nivalis]MCW3484971.1 hypothetical protein [Chitinophaga nivalis]